MTDKPKRAKPALVAVYVTVAKIDTSKGPAFHGDTIKLPKAEAEDLKCKGAVE